VAGLTEDGYTMRLGIVGRSLADGSASFEDMLNLIHMLLVCSKGRPLFLFEELRCEVLIVIEDKIVVHVHDFSLYAFLILASKNFIVVRSLNWSTVLRDLWRVMVGEEHGLILQKLNDFLLIDPIVCLDLSHNLS
jgi:hypothetical protein